MTPNIEALKLRYRLYGLPQDWFGVTFDDIELAPTEVQRLKGAFSILRKGSVCYIQGNAGPVANQYLEQGLMVRGVDASIYINDPFDKEEKKSLPDADVVFIYNCEETTTQLTLTQKVLKKLVQNYSHNTMVVLCGDIIGRTFSKDYYNVQNTCAIPKKKEAKWL